MLDARDCASKRRHVAVHLTWHRAFVSRDLVLVFFFQPSAMAQVSSFLGKPIAVAFPQPHAAAPRRMFVRAEADAPSTTRRVALLGGLTAAGAILTRVESSSAAYGEAAKIFGKPTDTSGFIPFVGEGFALLLPSKWNPSKEAEFPGTILRWEDNSDALSHVVITRTPTDKASIDQVATPEKFLESISFYIGQQVFKGETASEGGFAKDKVSTASLLDQETVKDKNGRSYYKYNLLVRAADGNEGGRHVLLTATVGSGSLYVAKVQCGDKRWFKGADKQALKVSESFTVA